MGISYLGQINVGEIMGKLDGYGCILMEVRVFSGKPTGFDYFDNGYQLDGVLSWGWRNGLILWGNLRVGYGVGRKRNSSIMN